MGNLAPEALIKELNLNTALPVISAGGVSTKSDLDKMVSYGAVGICR
jgi:nitronate monooxygenase